MFPVQLTHVNSWTVVRYLRAVQYLIVAVAGTNADINSIAPGCRKLNGT